MNRKTAWFLVLSALFCTIFAGCGGAAAPPPETGFPSIKVYSGKTNIEWIVGTNRLGNAETDREDNLIRIMKDHLPDDLVYLKNGETITIEFDGEAPDRAKLTEHIIYADGSAKHTTENEGTVIAFALENGKGSFAIEKNYVTALSSDSADYAPGAVIKGYRLVCYWEKGACEYFFSIRGDAAFLLNSPEAFKARELLNYYLDDDMPWKSTIELEIPEFEGVKFQWTPEAVTANGENIFSGMPIWNVYLVDLNGDTFPEICATVSIGSGVADTRIILYDYLNKNCFDLSDRMVSDYSLSLEDGKLTVTQTAYTGTPGAGPIVGTGHLIILENNLVFVRFDSVKSE